MKKITFLLSLFVLISLSGFAQFQEVAKMEDYPTLYGNYQDYYGTSVAADDNIIVVGSPTSNRIGYVYIYEFNGSTYDTLAILTPSDGELEDQFGASVSVLGDVVIVGAPGKDAGVVYVFSKPLSGWEDMTETAVLTASDGSLEDQFGYSVKLLEDLIIVGAPRNGFGHEGSVYVFEKPLSDWENMTQTAKLTMSVAPIEDDKGIYSKENTARTFKFKMSEVVEYSEFGVSVAAENNTIVIGASYFEIDGSNTGAVFVFEKPGANWLDMTETVMLYASDGESDDYFGESLSISDDYIAVLAKRYNDGRVYLFEKPVTGWTDASTEDAILTSSESESAYFWRANSVAILGDYIAMGAYWTDDDEVYKGLVYMYQKPSSGWINATESFTLNTYDEKDSGFASSMAFILDVLVIGSPDDYYNSAEAGSASIFHKPISGWAQMAEETATLYPSLHISLNDLHMGKNVAIDGNVAVIASENYGENVAEVLEFDGATWHKVAILSPSASSEGYQNSYTVAIEGNTIVYGSVDDQAAFIFEKPSTGWEDMHETAVLTSDETSYRFGVGVAIDNDVIVVGDNGLGAFFVFVKSGATWSSTTETAKLSLLVSSFQTNLGSAIAIDNDVIVVGNSGDDYNGTGTGSAYVYTKPSSGWTDATETVKLTASDGASRDYFGSSVAISADWIAVGAYGDDDLGSLSGSVYLFEKSGSGWVSQVETVKLNASDGGVNDNFGNDVDLCSDYLLVAANNDGGVGSAYTFKLTSGSWSQTSKLTASDANGGDLFGTSVAIANNYLVIGSPNSDYNGFNAAGSAYLFQAPLTWTGAINNDWHTAANWDFNKEPLFYDDVFIDAGAQPSITSEANCYDIEMGPTAQMSIESSALDVNGSLLFGGDFIGSEIIQYKRYIQSDRWEMISSPLIGQSINRFLSIPGNTIVSNSGNYQMKDYDEATDHWAANYTSETVGDVELGKGYVVERGSNGIVTFEGEPNNATFNATLTRDGMGWNLIGNPFTSAIAATVNGIDSEDYLLNTSNLAALDPSYSALYIWVEDVLDPTNLDNYKLINNAGSGSLVQDYLQVGQGFFVKSISGGGSFEMTPAMQSHQTSIPFKSLENVSWTGIELIAESAEGKVKTNIAYNETMTRGLDVSYDAGFMNSHPQFAMYSKLIDDNGENFALQCLPTDFESLVVPIGLEAEAGSTITFKAQATNLPEDYAVVLEDRENGTFTTLETEQSVYTVTLENASIGTGRFYLHTSFKSALGANDLDQARFSVYAQASNNQLLINGNVEENTTATVYDVQGRLVQRFALQNGAQNRLSFNQETGVYIIKIQNAKGIVNQKFNWVK